MNSLGNRIRIIRGETNQIQFSSDIGIPQTNLSRYERDVSIPDLGLLIRLADKYGVALEWLIAGRGPMRSEVEHISPESALAPCERCLKLEKRLETAEDERRQSSEKLVETLQANVTLTAELGEQKLKNVQLSQQLETARQMCKEYAVALREAGGTDPIFDEHQIIRSSESSGTR